MSQALAKSWHCPIRLPVLWGNMDAFAHVNNTVYFVWFEQARLHHFARIASQSGNSEFMRPAEFQCVGPILSETSCRFRLPLTFEEHREVVVASRVCEVKEDRFKHEYVVVSNGKVAAEGSGQVVFFDYAKGKKASIPSEIRATIDEISAKPDELQDAIAKL